MNTTKSIDVQELKKYHNEDVIRRFMDNYDIDYQTSLDIFQELKKFFYLLHLYGDKIFMNEYMFVLDEMWHTFLMYTDEYYRFCNTYFGRLLAHTPASYKEKTEIDHKLKTDKKNIETELRKNAKEMFEIIYDELGPETLVKWIKQYGEYYTLEKLTELRKPLTARS